jgi:hypothetical protein
MLKRRCVKQTEILEEPCEDEAQRLRESASFLPHGAVREAALRKARQIETASRISEWLRSSELHPPK